MIKKTLLAILALGLSVSLCAEELRVSARIGTALDAQNRVVLEIQIVGKEASAVPSPPVPNLKGNFKVLSTAESTSFSLVNGKMTSVKSIEMVLVPLKSGKLSIPPVRLSYQGKTFQTKPIVVSVSKQTPTATGKQGFLEAEVGVQQVMVGQPIPYRVVFYRRGAVEGDVILIDPAFTGVVAKSQATSQRVLKKVVQNQKFYGAEVINKQIIPITAGTLTLPPAQIKVVFDVAQGPVTLRSNPVTVRVIGLPIQGRPADFSGAIGDFTLSATVGKTRIRPSQPGRLTVTLSGTGNLDTVANLVIAPSNDMAVYLAKTETQNPSQKTFIYTLVPKRSGQLSLPILSVSTYSPTKKTYQTLETPHLTVEGEVRKQDKVMALKPISENLPAPKPLSKAPSSWPWALGLIGLNAALLLGMGLHQFGLKRFQKSEAQRLRDGALGTAKQALEAAKSLPSKEQAHVLEGILQTYLGHKIGVSCVGLKKAEQVALLQHYQVPEDLLVKWASLIDDLQFLAYAPVEQLDKQRGPQSVQAVLEGLDAVL
ncbi:MAG: BatD family protein [Candidatus Margulisiibacteriota bacterium]